MDFPSLFIPAVIYTSLNILALVLFSLDKVMAKMRMGRSSEDFLLLVAALGPFGALAAMEVFRHKIRHVNFFIVPVFALMHLLLFVWLYYQISG
jgi:uncharacterized membrane protein YsdA (DUF1294 family)